MFDIDDDKFGFCTGFELDGPVGEAGCDDKVCLFSFFISISFSCLFVCMESDALTVHPLFYELVVAVLKKCFKRV